jgi:YegS/Rv2252/BmrU family lipid kinase
MNYMDQTKWTLIVNPHAGGMTGEKDLPKIQSLLHGAAIQYDLMLSEYPGHIIQLTKEAIELGSRKFIVVGGDGTLNEVVNGVFLQNICLPEEVLLGMIPVGTGNDWIKTFGVPSSYSEAIALLKNQRTLFQDLGKLSYSEDGGKKCRYFSNMAGFGFDAMVAQKANLMKAKGRSGLLVYLQSLIWAFGQYKTRKVKLLFDDNTVEDLIFSVSVAIGKFNGGGMMQAPDAVPTNGVFDVTIIKDIGLWGILSNIAGLYSGKYVRDYRVLCFKTKTLHISAENPLSAEVDGESLGQSQFKIEILPQKLQVIVGEQMLFSPSENQKLISKA